MSSNDSELERQIRQHLREFHRRFFERGGENRFSDLVLQGQEAYAELVAALGESDRAERVDALVMLGRLFHSHGPTPEALRAVVTHSKQITEKEMGPEKHAALFAMGRSGDRSLIDSFVPVLAADEPAAINVALLLLGYARWQPAQPFILNIAQQNHPETHQAAIWALGQVGDPSALELLLPMLRRGKNLHWAIGAVGEIAHPMALDHLVPFLQHQMTDIRFLAASAISVITDESGDAAERRQWGWMVPELRAAAKDAFPPTALCAMMTLAKLGQRVEEADLRRALAMPASDVAFSGKEMFFLGRAGRTTS